MHVFADTHCHFYSSYKLEDFLINAFSNLNKTTVPTGEVKKCLFLTQSSKNSPSDSELKELLNSLGTFSVKIENDIYAVTNKSNGEILYILPGRQFISAEKLEVLALTYTEGNMDAVPLIEILEDLQKKGIPAILPWSPGKWCGKRGELIRDLISNLPEIKYMLGDIAMRAGKNTPILRLGEEKGIRVLPGSDTLPMRGEENSVGKYFAAFACEGNGPVTVEDYRKMLWNSAYVISGERNSYFKAISRWIRLFFNKG
jgi:hypothetical protein